MLSSDVLRGYNDAIILSSLLESDSYGYEISKRIRQTSDERYVMKETTLYSALNRMERAGYIDSYAGEITQGKPRTYWKITSEGRTYFADKLDEWELTQDVLNLFLTRKKEN